MYRVETTPRFADDMRRLDRALAVRIIERVEWLAQHPEVLRTPLRHVPPDLKGLHKYRVGDYRVLLWVDRQHEVLTLYGVAHRRSVYRELR